MTTPMFAMICANNVNRSTEAHDHLHGAGLRVCSFGAGNKVRFPGRSRYEPHIYEFFTPYEVMYRELKAENEALFRHNGVLAMLERDILTKKAPQKWQDNSTTDLAQLDVVVCFEDRIFDIVLEDLQLRKPNAFHAIHVICLDIKDTPQDAVIGGALALKLCQKINVLSDLEKEVPRAIDEFEAECHTKLLYALVYV